MDDEFPGAFADTSVTPSPSLNGLTVLHVNTSDRGGGAEAVASMLVRGERARALDSLLAVGWPRDARRSDVLDINNDAHRSQWAQFWIRCYRRLRREDNDGPLQGTTGALVMAVAEPSRLFSKMRGWEDFDYPATSHLMSVLGRRPELVHLHNLHGSYFDLREIASLSQHVPLAITLHDQWMFTGHCAYSFDCSRWESGCGSCPYLDTYPALVRDRTAENLVRKMDIYRKSKLFVSAPSHWLLEEAKRSVLSAGLVDARMTRLGIDLSVFKPGERLGARVRLGLPAEIPMVVFLANKARNNPFKDWRTAEEAIRGLGNRMSVLAVCVGSDGATERHGRAEIRYIPRQEDPEAIADWYRAADLYLHAARADNSPLTVIEAQACGTPVVASAVGGVPEIVKPLGWEGTPELMASAYPPDEATGMLVRSGDVSGFSRALTVLLTDRDLRSKLGRNAATWASDTFSFDRYLDETLGWYASILATQR